MNPRVTVIMRTKDRPLFLSRALDSVATQTFTDYELIVVNDGGEKAPVDAALASVPQPARSRMRVIHRERSTGMEAASNAALAEATGDFVAIHDDDDTWDPAFLLRTVAFLDEHSEHVGVAVRCLVVHEEINEDGSFTETSREILASDRTSWTLVDTLIASYSPPIAQLCRRSAILEVGCWDESMRTQGDWDFSIRLLSHGPAGFIDGDPLAHWHHRDNVTGVLGNSIFVAQDDHLSANARVRDRYLREAVLRDGVAPSNPMLGAALQNAEYYRRLALALHEENVSLHRAIAQVTAHLDMKISRVEDQVVEIQSMLTTINENIGRLAPKAIARRVLSSLRLRR